MIPGALLSFFAACAYAAPVLQQDSAIKPILSQIQDNFKIDATNPPYYDSEKYWEDTCVQNWGRCPRLGKYWRNWIVKGNATAYYNANVETSTINLGQNDSKMVLTTSTSTTDSTTKGWTIGAKISATGSGDGATVGAEASATYSDTTTSGKTETRQVSTEAFCKPGNECRIETWTFNAKISGFCQKKPMLDCRGERDQCADPLGGCQQFDDVYNNCLVQRPDENCEVQTPVYDQSGKPFTRIVLISNKLNEKTKRSELDGPATEYKIIG